jgi:glycolate oxidase FAD binding subunit
VETRAPGSIDEAAEALKGADKVRFAGGGTRAAWGDPTEPADVELSTTNLRDIVEHNAGDLTAVLDAGVGYAVAQEAFRDAGQMLAVDPPTSEGATIGGLIATADSGPLRHRYGAIRDLVVGATLVLADGTVAHSGGKVIKNVAGYDLAKLFCGSFGTLGLIARVAVRLHPVAPRTLTLSARTSDLHTLQECAVALAHLPVELDSLDVSFFGNTGRVLARFGGVDPDGRMDAARRRLADLPVEVTWTDNDFDIWEAQRRGQRSTGDAVLKVSALPGEMARVLDVARQVGGAVVGRAAMGLFWITLEGDEAELITSIDEIRGRLDRFHTVVLDAPLEVRRKVDVWGRTDDGGMRIMRRLKDRFDPTAKCNPGLFVAGI